MSVAWGYVCQTVDVGALALPEKPRSEARFFTADQWHGKLQTVKTQASNSVLPMPESLGAILREHLATWKENPERILFCNRRGRPYTGEKVVQKRLWPILDSLEIPRCGFHAFRHMHTALLLEVGASPKVAQAQLRHSDARITLGVYGHVVGDSQRNAVDRVADILRPIAPKFESSALRPN